VMTHFFSWLTVGLEQGLDAVDGALGEAQLPRHHVVLIVVLQTLVGDDWFGLLFDWFIFSTLIYFGCRLLRF